MKKKLALAVAVIFAVVFAVPAFAEEAAAAKETQPSVNVGGHIKLSVFDRVDTINRNGAIQTSLDKTYGVVFKELDLFISGKINDWIGFEVDPKFSQSTGATPKLGTTSTAAASTFVFNSFGHGKAVITFELPQDIHMEVGQIHPIFTMEYGKELFWEDEFNVGPFVGSHGPAGAYHDAGIQLDKTLNFGDISLPVYLYYTNGQVGSAGPDNNNQPGGLIHIEPVWGGLTIGASFYANRPDNAEKLLQTGYTFGFNYKWEGLTVKAEYAKGYLQDGAATGVPENEEGYFGKILYRVLPWFQVMFSHESDLDFIGVPGKSVRIVKYEPGFQIFLSDSTIIESGVDIQKMTMRDNSKGGVFTRPSVNIRLTF